MAKAEEASIDEILKSIREAIIEKEYRQATLKPLPAQMLHQEPEDEIFELSRNMMIKREDIPYQLGVWSFDDVAKKMMKKYKNFFGGRDDNSANPVRVSVKEESRLN